MLDVLHAVELRRFPLRPQMTFLSISPNMKWIATGAWQGAGVSVWETETGREVCTLPVDEEAQVAFSPDGKWLVTSSSRNTVWEVGTWQLHADFPRLDYAGLPGQIAFASGGRFVAVFAGDAALSTSSIWVHSEFSPA